MTHESSGNSGISGTRLWFRVRVSGIPGFASCYPKFPNKIRVSGISGSGSGIPGSGIPGSGFGLRVFCPALGGALDSHCSLSGARHIIVPIRVWSCWPLEPFVFLLHRSIRCHTGQSGDLWLLRDTVCQCTLLKSTVGAQGVVAPLAH
jgi:hypothetical protein